jgi:hypothetical protein
MFSGIQNGQAWYRIGGSGRIWVRSLLVTRICPSIRSGNTGQSFGRFTTRKERGSPEMRNPTRRRRVGDNAMGVESAFLGIRGSLARAVTSTPTIWEEAGNVGALVTTRGWRSSLFWGSVSRSPVLSPARLRLIFAYLHVPPLTVNLPISPSSGVSFNQSRWVVVIHFCACVGRWLIRALRRLGSSSPKISSIR